MKLHLTVLLVLLGFACLVAGRQTEVPVTSIQLERTMCFGTCPAYRVVLQPNGKLSYEGIAYVKRKGKFTASFHPDEFRKLVAIAKRVGFDSLAPSYSAPVTDMPTAIVTVKRGTAVKRVSDYGSSAPAEAWAMQELIDVVVNGADDWKPVKKAG